jgi:peptide chain release factor 1
MEDSELKVERITGSGPGGQHRNKTASCIRLTHLPSGVQVTIDGRNQHQNLRLAKKELAARIKEKAQKAQATHKKARRDQAIKDTRVVRTYKYKEGVVKDHRSGKTASLKEVMKGHIELLR